jgi:O-antigen/teichoic acid export membrane protein
LSEPNSSLLSRARPLLFARLAGAVVTIAVPMVLARVLVPASYGTFKQAWLVASTLFLVLPMGITQSLYYFVPREPERRDRFVAQALWATTLVGFVAAGTLLAARPLVAAHFDNPELTRLLPWVAAFTGFILAGAALDLAWNATGRIGAAAIARVATEVTRALGMIAGALLTDSVEGVFAGILAAAALRTAVTWVALGRAHGLRIELAALRRQVAYTLPFGLAFLVLIPQQQFHHYAVGAAVSAAAFAVYSVGTFQLPFVDILYTPVSELLQLGIAEAEREGRPHRASLALFHEAVLQLAFAFLPIAGLFFVVAPDLIAFLFSDPYLPATPIFRVAVLSIVLAALPLDGVMRARAQNRFMLGLSVAKLAATVPLVLGGLAAWGPIGALCGWIVADATSRMVMLVRTARLFDVPLRAVLPNGPLVRQLAAAVVAIPAGFGAAHAAGASHLARLLASGLAFGAAYLAIVWITGSLPAGWVDVFRRRDGRARVPATAGEP